MRTWSEWLAKHAKLVFVIVAVITVILSVGIKKLTLDTDMQNLLGITKQSLFSNQLPPIKNNLRDVLVVVYDPNLFAKAKLIKLNQLQAKLSNITSIEKVDSLFSMPNLVHYFETKKKVPLLNLNAIETVSVSELKHIALSNRIYIHSVINPDATSLAFAVKIKEVVPDDQLLDVRNAIEQTIYSYQPDFKILFQMGELENNFYSTEGSVHDIAITGSLTLAILIVAFSFFFRSSYLGLAPFLTAGLAMTWTLGIMGYFNLHFNVMTSLAAIMTYTVGTMENAHFINAYQKSYKENASAKISQHISRMYRSVLLPLFLTTLSALLGFVCNFFSTIGVLQSFAITICLALFLNALLLCLLTPALLVFSKVKSRNTSGFILLRRIVFFIYKKTTYFSWPFSLILCLVIGSSFWLAPKIPLDVMPYSYFYEKSDFIKKVRHLNQYMTGTERLYVDIATSDPEGFKNIDTLTKLFEVERNIQKNPMTSNTISAASIMASTFQLFFESEDDGFYRVPHSRPVFMSFFDGIKNTPEINILLSKDNSVARIAIAFYALTTLEAQKYQQEVQHILESGFENTSIRFEIENPNMDILVATSSLLKVQLSGVSMIYLSIFIIMLVMFKSVKAGMISIIPNMFPISSVILILYFFKMPFNIVSVIVLTGVLGMAADDTLHILYYFKKNFIKSRDNDIAIAETMNTLVRPVSVAAFTLILGMSMLVFSVIKASMQYGVLMIIGALAAWVANLTVTPFLLKKINITKRL